MHSRGKRFQWPVRNYEKEEKREKADDEWTSGRQGCESFGIVTFPIRRQHSKGIKAIYTTNLIFLLYIFLVAFPQKHKFLTRVDLVIMSAPTKPTDNPVS